MIFYKHCIYKLKTWVWIMFVIQKINLTCVTCAALPSTLCNCGSSWFPMECSVPSVNYGKSVSLSNVGVVVTGKWWRTQLRLHSNIIIEHCINKLHGEHKYSECWIRGKSERVLIDWRCRVFVCVRELRKRVDLGVDIKRDAEPAVSFH